MRDAQNIKDVSKLNIDMLGFNFWPRSKRFVGNIAPEVFSELPKRIKSVGLFVDEKPQNIISHVKDHSLDYIQLHGSESPEMITDLRHRLDTSSASETKIIKAFGISTYQDLEQTKYYEGMTDLFIFDYKSPGKGGSGMHFDWSLLKEYHGSTPFLLSGGIGLEDIEAINSFHHPMFAGVDVNSKFETSPAMKDVEKLKVFVETLKSK